MDDHLMRQWKELIDSKIEEKGFPKICQAASQKIIAAARKIEEEQKSLKREIQLLVSKLKGETPDQSEKTITKDIILIDDDDESSQASEIENISKIVDKPPTPVEKSVDTVEKPKSTNTANKTLEVTSNKAIADDKSKDSVERVAIHTEEVKRTVENKSDSSQAFVSTKDSTNEQSLINNESLVSSKPIVQQDTQNLKDNLTEITEVKYTNSSSSETLVCSKTRKTSDENSSSLSSKEKPAGEVVNLIDPNDAVERKETVNLFDKMQNSPAMSTDSSTLSAVSNSCPIDSDLEVEITEVTSVHKAKPPLVNKQTSSIKTLIASVDSSLNEINNISKCDKAVAQKVALKRTKAHDLKRKSNDIANSVANVPKANKGLKTKRKRTIIQDDESNFVTTEDSQNTEESDREQPNRTSSTSSVYVKPAKSDIWYKGEIIDEYQAYRPHQKKFNVRLSSAQQKMMFFYQRCMASAQPTRLKDEVAIGSRIVAARPSDTVDLTISKRYNDIIDPISVMYAGIVAELACEQNRNRYLVFFDDGYAQYYSLNNLFPVLNSSKEVWNDVSESCREFIKEYLQEYPYRPLVSTKLGSPMQTEWNGSWWKGTVTSIDGSLIKILFDVDRRSEWLYKGTTRLEPLYNHFMGIKKKRKNDTFIDDRITHPNFGVSKYSLKDPTGSQQRKDWGLPAEEIEYVCTTSPDQSKQLKLTLKRQTSSTSEDSTKLKRQYSSDSSSRSSDQQVFRRKKRKVGQIDDQSPELPVPEFTSEIEPVETAEPITSQEALGVLAALQLESPEKSPEPEPAQVPSTPTIDDVLDVAHIRMLREKGDSYTKIIEEHNNKRTAKISRRQLKYFCKKNNIEKKEKTFEFLDLDFIRERRMKGHSFDRIAKHYKNIYPHLTKNMSKKHIAHFCLKHDISSKGPVLSGASSPGSSTRRSPSPRRGGPVNKQYPTYSPHECNYQCLLENSLFEKKHKSGLLNYLSIPSQLGWRRLSLKKGGQYKREIYYKTPCGKALRNLNEVSRYLRETQSRNICIDMFCFQSNTSCRTNVYAPKTALTIVTDVAKGHENLPIACVNEVSEEQPQNVTYVNARKVDVDVRINTDTDFMVCCDCTDSCQDKTRCQCAQLTIETSDAIDNQKDENAGYTHRRLKQCTTTGVYECNQNCLCHAKTCHNRVVQNGIKLRLQVFQTGVRGWGLRCMDDIPKGTFVCTYSGQLLTEQTANKEGIDFGDEYLAELDHIEVVEQEKEGYESDVPELRNTHTDDEDDDYDDFSDTEVESESSCSVMLISSDSCESSGDESQEKEKKSAMKIDIKKMEALKLNVKKLSLNKEAVKTNNESKTETGSDKSIAQKVLDCIVEKVDVSKRISDSAAPERTLLNEGDEKVEEVKIKDNKMIKKSTNITKAGTESSHNPPNTKSEVKRHVAKKSTGARALAYKSHGGKFFMTQRMDGGKADAAKTCKDRPSTRFYYQGDSQMYIIDAKNHGNVGRYMNHSCSPNIFVQNVFVDTHDLRFPIVAFFSSQYIPAYTELTWDYNYEVGSVPNKILICQCGSKECKGRLL